MARIGAHHHKIIFGFFAHNQEVAVINFLVKGALFALGQMNQEIANVLLAFAPLNKAIIFDADKKGMLWSQR